MDIEVKSDVFRRIDKEVALLSKEDSQKYFYEILKIQEKYNVVIENSKEDILNSAPNQAIRDAILSMVNESEDFKIQQKLSLKKTDEGILFRIYGGINQSNEDLAEILLGYDGELHFDDKGTAESAYKNGISESKEDYLHTCVRMLYALGRIIYNINNKVTVQKQRTETVQKTKKVKKKNSRKKETQKIIINKPIVVYTDEQSSEYKEEESTLRTFDYKVASWESRGYWRTNGKTGQREWIAASIKKRRKLESIEETEIKKQNYVYK